MGRKCGPGNNGGRGFSVCDASGQLVKSQNRMRDVRQGVVDRDHADYVGPTFGTNHPMDMFDPGVLDDPSPIPEARPSDTESEMAQEPPGGPLDPQRPPFDLWPGGS